MLLMLRNENSKVIKKPKKRCGKKINFRTSTKKKSIGNMY